MTTNVTEPAEEAPADPFTRMPPFDPYAPAFPDDPYPTFQRLRDESGPVVNTIPGMHLVIGHKRDLVHPARNALRPR